MTHSPEDEPSDTPLSPKQFPSVNSGTSAATGPRSSIGHDSIASNITDWSSQVGRSCVVRFPRNASYGTPHVGNGDYARLMNSLRKKKGCCRGRMCTILGFFICLGVIIGAVAALSYYFICRGFPYYRIETISVDGMDLKSLQVTPRFNVNMTIHNWNPRIGITYEKPGMDFRVYHDKTQLANGNVAGLYQSPKTLVIMPLELVGPEMVLLAVERGMLIAQQKMMSVPLRLKVITPVKLKVWLLQTWKMTVKVTCKVTLSRLTRNAEIRTGVCHVHLVPWQCSLVE